MGNLCFAPAHGDTKSGDLLLTNSYYYIGHFSKYIRPGAKRISSVSSANVVLSTAFVNQDGSIVIVAMNQGDEDKAYRVTLGNKTTDLEIPAHGIQTLILKS